MSAKMGILKVYIFYGVGQVLSFLGNHYEEWTQHMNQMYQQIGGDIHAGVYQVCEW